MNSLYRRVCFVFFLGLLHWTVVAEGVVLTVPGDFPTIAAAVTGAPDGATIHVGSGVYGFVDAPNLGKNLTLLAVNGPDQTIISGGNSSRLLRIENGLGFGNLEKNLVFIGFTFREGVGVQGFASPVTIARARPVFIDCVFENNRAFDKGGAVLVFGEGAHPVFLDCIFRNNQSDLYGGAALVNGNHAQATFKRCRFENNTTRTPATTNFSQGGALKFSEGGGRVIDSVFIGNSTAYSGGAIMMLNQFTASQEDLIEIRNCYFEGNYARPVPGAQPASPPPSEGGALMVEDFVHAVVEGSFFTNNVAASGGGIMVYRGRLTLEDSVLDGNLADGENYLGFGGAIGINSYDNGAPNRPEAQAWLRDVMIRNNRAPVGGGIYASGDSYWGTSAQYRGDLFMTRVVIENNVSTVANDSFGNGGGLFLGLMNASGTNVYLLNNVAEGLGGALVLITNTDLYLRDSFIVGNQAILMDSEIHAPGNPLPTYVNTVRAYNGGGGSDNLSHVAVIPPRTMEGAAYVTYLNLPFGSPTLNGAALPNRGGYAAGTVRLGSIAAPSTVTLASQFPNATAPVALGYRGLVPPAYQGNVPTLPATIEAERYDEGGSLLAYHDRTTVNQGGALRPAERVDISSIATASGGFAVSFVESGEWLEYSFYSPGVTVRPTVRVATPEAGGAFTLAIQGQPLGTGVVNVPATGGWAQWQEIELPIVTIAEGYHTLRFTAIRGGFNLDSVAFISPDPTLALSSTRLLRSVKEGQSAVAQTLRIWNSGANDLNFTLSADQPWLTPSPVSGLSTGPNDRRTINLAIDATGLPIGTYTATVTIASSEAVNAPRTSRVILRVRPDRYVVNDYDGDGTSDLGLYFPPAGQWFVFRSGLGMLTDQFGFAGTIQVSGDFDGDGIGDLAIYHPVGGTWYIFGSDRGFFTEQFGFAGTIPIAGDFDGDGISDLGVYHPLTGMWYIFGSDRGFFTEQFGFTGTIPVSGDFDGDGISDLCLYHPPTGMWFIFGSDRGFFTEQFGFDGTIPIAGDFDGDGTSDLGVYHPPTGMWFIFGSTRGFFTDQFGFAGTIPVPGDFDGDGVSDLAVYYPPDGAWFIFRSSEGFLTDQFGFAGTVPLGATVTQP